MAFLLFPPAVSCRPWSRCPCFSRCCVSCHQTGRTQRPCLVPVPCPAMVTGSLEALLPVVTLSVIGGHSPGRLSPTWGHLFHSWANSRSTFKQRELRQVERPAVSSFYSFFVLRVRSWRIFYNCWCFLLVTPFKGELTDILFWFFSPASVKGKYELMYSIQHQCWYL